MGIDSFIIVSQYKVSSTSFGGKSIQNYSFQKDMVGAVILVIISGNHNQSAC